MNNNQMLTTATKLLSQNGADPIAVCIMGSRAYGCATDNSDFDVRGVYYDSLRSLIGLRPQDETIQYKNESEGLDFSTHALRKFVHLCVKGSPNELELLFVRDDMVLATEEFQLLKDIRMDLISKQIYARFGGYATQMYRFGTEKLSGTSFDSDKDPYKPFAHCARLYLEGTAFLNGEAPVLDAHAELLRRIRSGEMTESELTKKISELSDAFEKANDKSTLPVFANRNKAEALVMYMLANHYSWRMDLTQSIETFNAL